MEIAQDSQFNYLDVNSATLLHLKLDNIVVTLKMKINNGQSYHIISCPFVPIYPAASVLK